MENNINSDELSFEDLEKVASYGESVPREVIEEKAIEAGEDIFRKSQLEDLKRQREELIQSQSVLENNQEQTYSNTGRSHR